MRLTPAGKEKCLLCNQNLVSDHIPPQKARIALVGEFPGQEELKFLMPFVGYTGRILKAEMRLAGLSYDDCVATNLWKHKASEDEKEYEWHLGKTLSLIAGTPIILLMGSDIVRAILDESVSHVQGLWHTSPLLPRSKLMPMVNPAHLMHGTVGEFRLALQRVKNETEIESSSSKRSRPARSSAEHSGKSGASKKRNRTGSR